MKLIIATLLAFALFGCDSASEESTVWPQSLAIDSDPHTSWRVVIIGEVTDGETPIEIPDYATEIIVIREGDGFVRVHSTPDLADYSLSRGGSKDTLRVRVH